VGVSMREVIGGWGYLRTAYMMLDMKL
jgi:hypothetical protein